jgi:hypothetical protein
MAGGTRPRRRVVAGTAGAIAVAALAVTAGLAGAGTYRQPDRVLVATTGDHSELVSTLDIQTQPGIAPQVVMSLPSRRLGALQVGDRLKTSAELEVTTDCLDPEPRCVGNPYDYNPLINAQLILAPNRSATGGAGTTPISSLQRRTCRQQLPDRQHHCTLAFMWPFIDLLGPSPPCVPGPCFVNLVADAYSRLAQPGDKLIVGEDEPDGTTVQDKGRVNAVRLRPNVAGPKPTDRVTTSVDATPVVNQLVVGSQEDRNQTVVLSQELPDLKRGDQLAVSARMDTDVSKLPYNALVHSRLILTSRPDATTVTHLAKQVTSLDGELSEANGFNCTHATTPCRTQKVGVGSLIADAVHQSGEPAPMYVNLVVGTMAKRAQANPGDTVDVLRGSLAMTRYPASRRG